MYIMLFKVLDFDYYLNFCLIKKIASIISNPSRSKFFVVTAFPFKSLNKKSLEPSYTN